MRKAKMLTVLIFALNIFISNSALDVPSSKDYEDSNKNGTYKYVNSNSNSSGITDQLSNKSEARGLKYLTPGQEFLLSVASYEDAKDTYWGRLPHLSNVLQKGELNINRADINKKKDKAASIPFRMFDMMKVMTATEKADGDDDTGNGDSNVFKPLGFLDNFVKDPTNILLIAIIPFSILLAAVIPLLVNQLTSGNFMRPVLTTTASSDSKSKQQRQFLENMVPILEGIARFGARLSKEVTKEKTDKRKFSILTKILKLVSSFISENWLHKFGSTTIHRLRSCDSPSCKRKKKL